MWWFVAGGAGRVSVKIVLQALGKIINNHLWKSQKAFVSATGLAPKYILHVLYTFLWKAFFFFSKETDVL